MAADCDKLIHIKLHGGNPAADLSHFFEDPEPEVRKQALEYIKKVPSDALKKLVLDPEQEVAIFAINHPEAWEPHLHHALQSNDPTIHAAVASHPKLTDRVLNRLLESDTPMEVKMLALRNKHLPSRVLDKVIKDRVNRSSPDDDRLLIQAAGHPMTLDTTLAHVLTSAPNTHVAAVSANFIHSPEVLLELANHEELPLSLKKILLLNQHFDANNWWRLKDPHLRATKKEDANAGI